MAAVVVSSTALSVSSRRSARPAFPSVQHVGDELGEAGLVQLARRDVDRDVLEVESLAAPGDELAERRVQSPAADLLDQAARLREGDEIAGRNQPARRMAPADQRLGADDACRSPARAAAGSRARTGPLPAPRAARSRARPGAAPRRSSRLRRRRTGGGRSASPGTSRGRRGAAAAPRRGRRRGRGRCRCSPTRTRPASRSENGFDSVSIAFLATSAASAGRRSSVSTTANSSPPSRATRSDLRTHSRRRVAASASRASPAACPAVSFTAAKPSRSTNSTASIVPLRYAAATARDSASAPSRRFGSPVRESKFARR